MNPLITSSFSIAAQPMVITEHAVGKQVEDWSRCRSPSRARRRERRGFPQHVIRYREPACYQANGTLYIHPKLAAELKRAVKRDTERRMDNDFHAAIHAGSLGLNLSRLGFRFRP